MPSILDWHVTMPVITYSGVLYSNLTEKFTSFQNSTHGSHQKHYKYRPTRSLEDISIFRLINFQLPLWKDFQTITWTWTACTHGLMSAFGARLHNKPWSPFMTFFFPHLDSVYPLFLDCFNLNGSLSAFSLHLLQPPFYLRSPSLDCRFDFYPKRVWDGRYFYEHST